MQRVLKQRSDGSQEGFLGKGLSLGSFPRTLLLLTVFPSAQQYQR